MWLAKGHLHTGIKQANHEVSATLIAAVAGEQFLALFRITWFHWRSFVAMMNAAVFGGPGGIVLKQRPIPEIGPLDTTEAQRFRVNEP